MGHMAASERAAAPSRGNDSLALSSVQRLCSGLNAFVFFLGLFCFPLGAQKEQQKSIKTELLET